MNKKLIFFTIVGLGFPALSAASPKGCVLSISDPVGETKNIKIPDLKSNPTVIMGKNDFEYRQGLYCQKNKSLDGRFEFQDASGSQWTITLLIESIANKKSLATILYSRDGRKAGPQMDIRFAGTPCGFIEQKQPFTLVGLETKDQRSFSASLNCQQVL